MFHSYVELPEVISFFWVCIPTILMLVFKVPKSVVCSTLNFWCIPIFACKLGSIPRWVSTRHYQLWDHWVECFYMLFQISGFHPLVSISHILWSTPVFALVGATMVLEKWTYLTFICGMFCPKTTSRSCREKMHLTGSAKTMPLCACNPAWCWGQTCLLFTRIGDCMASGLVHHIAAGLCLWHSHESFDLRGPCAVREKLHCRTRTDKQWQMDMTGNTFEITGNPQYQNVNPFHFGVSIAIVRLC